LNKIVCQITSKNQPPNREDSRGPRLGEGWAEEEGRKSKKRGEEEEKRGEEIFGLLVGYRPNLDEMEGQCSARTCTVTALLPTPPAPITTNVYSLCAITPSLLLRLSVDLFFFSTGFVVRTQS
jgi:hypothetical protein